MSEAYGLLVHDKVVDVPGVKVYAPAHLGGPAFNRLDPGDYSMRPTTWVRYIVLHTTGGLWPQEIHSGAGPAGHAREILDMWDGDDHGPGLRVHSGAPIVVDFDGTVFCNQDIVLCASYHAEGANPYSVGIEMCTLPSGAIYEATLKATARIVATLTCSGLPGSGRLPIPFQVPRGPYRNEPMARCETGTGSLRRQHSPADLVGVIGHRDNTSERGFGDPGDAIWAELLELGAEPVNFDTGEEMALARARQLALNALDAKAGYTQSPLVIDGVVGPASLVAMRRHGFARWRDVV